MFDKLKRKPKEDVPFKPMGTKVQSGVIVMHVQTQLGDWE